MAIGQRLHRIGRCLSLLVLVSSSPAFADTFLDACPSIGEIISSVPLVVSVEIVGVHASGLVDLKEDPKVEVASADNALAYLVVDAKVLKKYKSIRALRAYTRPDNLIRYVLPYDCDSCTKETVASHDVIVVGSKMLLASTTVENLAYDLAKVDPKFKSETTAELEFLRALQKRIEDISIVVFPQCNCFDVDDEGRNAEADRWDERRLISLHGE